MMAGLLYACRRAARRIDSRRRGAGGFAVGVLENVLGAFVIATS